MQKNNKTDGRKLFLRIWGITMLVLALVLVSVRLSAAPGDEKKIPGTYDRLQTIEAPQSLLRANPTVTRTTGWIGNKRVDLKTTQTNKYTRVEGWVGNERINVKERKDD